MKWYHLLGLGVGFAVVSSLLNRARVMSNLKNIRLSKNFTLDEFVVTSTGLDNVPGPQEIENLRLLVENIMQPLRTYLNRPIVISSGYRSQLVNTAIGGSATSQHSKGQAADFSVPGMTNAQIIDAIRALKLPYDQLIDEQLKGKNWIHISYVRNGRRQWMTARDGDNGKAKYETVQIG